MLGAEPCQRAQDLSGVAAGQCQLPSRCVPELNHLSAQRKQAAAAGGQIHGAHGNLRRQPQFVGRRGTMRHDGFPTLPGKTLDQCRGGRRPVAEARRHGNGINTAFDAKQCATARHTAERLVDGGAISQMQQALGDQGRAFR